jgi:hypothetical protein
MADSLSVDVDAIDEFGYQLDSVQSAFDSTGGTVSSFAQPAGSKVQNALEDFARQWAAKQTILDSYFSALSKMAHTSAAELRKTDQQLAQAVQTQPAPGGHGRTVRAD